MATRCALSRSLPGRRLFSLNRTWAPVPTRRASSTDAAVMARAATRLYAIRLIVKPVAVATAFSIGSYACATVCDGLRGASGTPKARRPFATGISFIDDKLGSFRWDLYVLPCALSAVHVGIFALTRAGVAGGAIRRALVHWPDRPTAVSTLLNQFFHMESRHVAVVVGSLFAFGPFLQETMGPAHFVACALTSGVVGTATSHVVRVATFSKIPIFGGASSALGMAYAAAGLYPHWRPEPLYALRWSIDAKDVAAFGALMSAIFLITGSISFDHAAHLGGLAYGWWRGSVRLNDIIARIEADDRARAAKARAPKESDAVFDPSADDIQDIVRRYRPLFAPSTRQSDIDAWFAPIVNSVVAWLNNKKG